MLAHRLKQARLRAGLSQEKLGKLAGVQQLEFNLINRVLGVTHDLPNDSPIIDAIQSLGMQADPIVEGTPAAEPPAKKHWWPLALSGVAALGAEYVLAHRRPADVAGCQPVFRRRR